MGLRIARVMSFLLAGLVVVAILAESALWLRAKVFNGGHAEAARPGDFRVLFIGDSVMGFLDREPKGLAGRIKTSAPADIFFTEFSEPALLTRRLMDTASDLVSQQRPDLVVLMAGKSDYDAVLSDAPAWFMQFRISRLAMFVWGDLSGRFKRSSSVDAIRASRLKRIDEAWAVYAKLDCEAAIPLFSQLLVERHDSPSDAPNARALYDCYLKTRSFEAGSDFFAKLAENSKDGSTYRMYAGSMKLQLTPINSSARKAVKAQMEKSVLTAGDPRSIFKTKLWLEKTSGSPKDFARTLREMTPSESAKVDPRTTANLRHTIQTFLTSGAHVILLQYPTDHGAIHRSNFEEFAGRISFIELRQWLLEEPVDEISTDVDEDIEHLSLNGAGKLAPRLLKEIEALRTKKLNQKRK